MPFTPTKQPITAPCLFGSRCLQDDDISCSSWGEMSISMDSLTRSKPSTRSCSNPGSKSSLLLGDDDESDDQSQSSWADLDLGLEPLQLTYPSNERTSVTSRTNRKKPFKPTMHNNTRMGAMEDISWTSHDSSSRSRSTSDNSESSEMEDCLCRLYLDYTPESQASKER